MFAATGSNTEEWTSDWGWKNFPWLTETSEKHQDFNNQYFDYSEYNREEVEWPIYRSGTDWKESDDPGQDQISSSTATFERPPPRLSSSDSMDCDIGSGEGNYVEDGDWGIPTVKAIKYFCHLPRPNVNRVTKHNHPLRVFAEPVRPGYRGLPIPQRKEGPAGQRDASSCQRWNEKPQQRFGTKRDAYGNVIFRDWGLTNRSTQDFGDIPRKLWIKK